MANYSVFENTQVSQRGGRVSGPTRRLMIFSTKSCTLTCQDHNPEQTLDIMQRKLNTSSLLRYTAIVIEFKFSPKSQTFVNMYVGRFHFTNGKG